MAHKSYAIDPAKEKSRMLLKDILENTLLKFMRPQDIKVLHLPGPDGMEYLQVYGPLGIPPENVIGIERNSALAEMARLNNPGTQVICTSLRDFTDEPQNFNVPSKYQVVSIDFTGNASANNLNEMMSVADLCNDRHFVFHGAIQKSREHKNSQDYLNSFGYRLGINEILRFSSNPNSFLEGDLVSMRDQALTYVLKVIANDSPKKRMPFVVERMCGPALNDIFLEAVHKLNLKSEHIFTDGKERSLDDVCTIEGLREMSVPFLSLMHAFARVHMANLVYGQLKSDSLNSESELRILTEMFCDVINNAVCIAESGKFRQIQNLVRYAYVSKSRTPMIGDIVYVRSDVRLQQAYQEALLQVRGHDFRITNIIDLLKISRKIQSIGSKYKFQNAADFETGRIYLGSSALPILRREKAIELLQQGANVDEILAQYNGMSRRRLGAFSAHITRGTYNTHYDAPEKDLETQKELRQDIETRVLLAAEGAKVNGGDVLSKQDAVEYLRAGIPRQEIHAAYPGTSMPQLVAWEFWLKRGKY